MLPACMYVHMVIHTWLPNRPRTPELKLQKTVSCHSYTYAVSVTQQTSVLPLAHQEPHCPNGDVWALKRYGRWTQIPPSTCWQDASLGSTV